MQQFGALGVRCVFQDGANLAPGDEGAFVRKRVVVAWRGGERVPGCEGGNAAAIGLIEERLGGCGAAQPAWAVG